MTIPFTANEIRKAIAKMKLNKSPGCDEIPVELVKYAPDRIHEQIAKIYSNMAETGNIPKEVTYGILKPLQKPNNVKGPLSNLGPIILLSSLRKIFAACITQDLCSMYHQHESKIDWRQKYYHRKHPTDATDQQPNMSSPLH